MVQNNHIFKPRLRSQIGTVRTRRNSLLRIPRPQCNDAGMFSSIVCLRCQYLSASSWSSRPAVVVIRQPGKRMEGLMGGGRGRRRCLLQRPPRGVVDATVYQH